MEDQGGEEDSGGPATNDRNEDFHVDVDLLLYMAELLVLWISGLDV